MAKRVPEEAFAYYVELGHERSYRAVGNKFGFSKRAITKLAVREKWAERLSTIEAEARARADKQLIESKVETHERELKLVKLMAARAMEGLSRFPATTTAEAARLGELSLKLRRLLEGEPSEHTAVSVEEVTRHEVRALLTSKEPQDDDDW